MWSELLATDKVWWTDQDGTLFVGKNMEESTTKLCMPMKYKKVVLFWCEKGDYKKILGIECGEIYVKVEKFKVGTEKLTKEFGSEIQ